jgi:hypothetical protein
MQTNSTTIKLDAKNRKGYEALTAVIQLKKGPHSDPARQYVQKYIPPAVGSAAAISARANARTHDTVLTIVHDVKAA